MWLKANINKETARILVITSADFLPKIKIAVSEFGLPIDYYVLNLGSLFEAGCARFNIFQYENIHLYEKILYLDTDILINADINTLFNLETLNDKIYALEEGVIGHVYWGSQFFDFSKYDKNLPAFTSGILFFYNSISIRELFQDTMNHIDEWIYKRKNSPPACLDQPFIVYNAISTNKYDNQLMKTYIENNPVNISKGKIIYHFPGSPGHYHSKYDKMNAIWKKINKITPVLFQTNKHPNEKYVVDMISSSLGELWKYEFYNDSDIVAFFITNPISDLPDIVQKYNMISKGAHKADLFRYYYLYINGGFFMDSDAMIYNNISSIVKDYDFISVDSSCHPGSIFQGILGSAPRNDIIKKALYNAYNTDPVRLLTDYHYWCKDLYNIIKKDTNRYNIKLYRELRRDDKGDEILDDAGSIIFKHYWKYKIIPPFQETDYSKEFKKIYETNYWIKGSGAGSYIENTIGYNNIIVDFIRKNDIRTVTDIGCGDWQSSYLIYDQVDNVDYVGIDCVKTVIDANKTKFPKYKFEQYDILCNTVKIRDSDLYIMKDVLQHWKLIDIYNFLDVLVKKKFKYIIITNNGNQTTDNLELVEYVGNGRGLHSKYLPLKKYNAVSLFNYYGGENKHMCVIQQNYTNWNDCNKDELNEFDYRILKTYETPNTLKRIGPSSDGGYVIADGFNYDLFISCGVADDIRFEEDFLDIHPIKCYAFDGTINVFPKHRNDMTWVNKNIGYANNANVTNLKEYIENSNNIFLKMDIEGSEFNWLDAMTKGDLCRFNQIVLEVHWPFDVYRSKMLEKLNETHYIIHIHGNNYCDRDTPKHMQSGRTYDGTVTIKHKMLYELKLPEVFEVTYINKRLVDHTLVCVKEIKFPTSLDYPNNPHAQDLLFSIPMQNSFTDLLVNNKYSWGSGVITFLENGKMDAFGIGAYSYLDKNIINAKFGGRVHKISFNEDYTKYTSIRHYDNEIVKGVLI